MKDKASRAMQHLDDGLIESVINEEKPKKNAHLILKRGNIMKNNNFRRWVAVAAAFAIIIAGGLFAGTYTAGAQGATIAFDVNPSIEIEVNGKETVTAVKALNEDAQIVIGDLDFKNVNLDVAVYAIIGSMVKNGYISADQNSILISVNSKSEKKANSLKDKISGEIGTLLEENNISASVITQSFKENDEINKKADENKISTAKATLIEKIVAAGLLDANGVPYTYEVLAQRNVNELKLILESKEVKVDGISSSGVASGKQYITREEAKAAALAKAGLAEADVTRFRIEMDFEDDRNIFAMVYEVEFVSGDKKYEYEILAKTGEILEEDIESVKIRDDDDDDNITASDNSITREEALDIAYNAAGVKKDDVRHPEIELDREGGKVVYEIEFKTATTEYEYEIDAATGEILKSSSEPND